MVQTVYVPFEKPTPRSVSSDALRQLQAIKQESEDLIPLPDGVVIAPPGDSVAQVAVLGQRRLTSSSAITRTPHQNHTEFDPDDLELETHVLKNVDTTDIARCMQGIDTTRTPNSSSFSMSAAAAHAIATSLPVATIVREIFAKGSRIM